MEIASPGGHDGPASTEPGVDGAATARQRVAERHGGDVALTSQEGVGTRVVLTLPCTARAEAAGE